MIDLRPWAKVHRYRWRYEESYKAELVDQVAAIKVHEGKSFNDGPP